MQILPDGHMITLMQAGDLADVYRLECAGQADPWSLEQFVAELQNPAAKIDLYRCSGELAGFLCSWLIAGELQIQNLVTAPEFRRMGVAARLLDHVLRRSSGQGLESAWLEVRASNCAAIKLYEKFGFYTVSRRAAYYPDKEDALIMTYQPGGELPAIPCRSGEGQG